MSRFQAMRQALRIRSGVRGVQRAVDDEIAFHIDARVEALRRGGHSESDAREIALGEFGRRRRRAT